MSCRLASRKDGKIAFCDPGSRAPGNGAAVARVSLKSGHPEMEPMPLDFTQYLSNRFGLTESDTSKMLGTWLRTYEPESVRREREEGAAEPKAQSGRAERAA